MLNLMGKVCEFTTKISEDLYYCNKYNSYCYLELPDRKQCTELYGEDYSESDAEAELYDDEENVEDSI